MFGTRSRLVAVLMLAGLASACSPGDGASDPAASASATASTPVPTAVVLPASASSAANPTAAASVGGAAGLGGPVAQGGDLCGLLGPGDFTAAGVSGATAPVENFDDSGNYYCVYAGDSGATGGIEFDAFVGDPAGSYTTMTETAGILSADATGQVSGADKAGTVLDGPGGMAGIAVCKGQFCFDIDIPTSSTARAQLISMAGLVLQRGSGLTS